MSKYFASDENFTQRGFSPSGNSPTYVQTRENTDQKMQCLFENSQFLRSKNVSNAISIRAF